MSAAEVQGICASPLLRGGAMTPSAATVQPARLAFGLRRALHSRGVVLLEGCHVTNVRLDGPRAPAVATFTGGEVHAGALVVTAGGAAQTLKPLRRRLTIGSSHMVVSEPVPDLLEQIGWTGGEAISDTRPLLHYMRTTPTGRIAFGWAGGRMGFGGRLGGRLELDATIARETARRMLRFFPELQGVRLTHAWGGPIDVSPDHLPHLERLPAKAPAIAAFGFTGNGVGPTHLAGRAIASAMLDGHGADASSALLDLSTAAWVPGEPARYIGGSLIRRALVAEDDAREQGRQPGRTVSFMTQLPERLGVHISR